MKRLHVMVLWLAIGVWDASHAAQVPRLSVYLEPPKSKPFTASKAGFGDRDLTYCSVGGVDLKFDIFYPRDAPSQKYPLVVNLHGGQLIAGTKSAVIGPNAPIQRTQYTARGFAFASIDYRLGPIFKLPAMIDDVKCAIRHLRARAILYNIDPDHIGVIGTSSGGYLAALLGLTGASAGFARLGGFAGVSSSVQAVVAEYPQVSFELPPFSRAEQESRDQALPRNSSADFKRRMSLATYVTPNAPPFLFFHGDADPALSPATSKDLHDRLRAAGVDSTYVLVTNGGHGWNPNAARRAGVPYGPMPTPDQILEQELAFFGKHLKVTAARDRP
jgi:acetyl esterase/lipase